MKDKETWILVSVIALIVGVVIGSNFGKIEKVNKPKRPSCEVAFDRFLAATRDYVDKRITVDELLDHVDVKKVYWYVSAKRTDAAEWAGTVLSLIGLVSRPEIVRKRIMTDECTFWVRQEGRLDAEGLELTMCWNSDKNRWLICRIPR